MRLRHELIVARRYEKPEMTKGLYISPAHRTDHSRSLWHVVRSSPEADAALALTLEPEWILVTPPRSGVYLDLDAEGRELFLLHAALVGRVIPWTKEGDMGNVVLGARILVRPDDPRQSNDNTILVTPDAYLRRPVTGRVEGVGPDVDDDDVKTGVRVLYSLYAGTDVEIDGDRHVIMDASQAMMVLDDDTEVTT